jgi:putative NIF3 family GTP cyclohydrolase 1 type 2
MNSMTAALVEQTATVGADTYVTGQARQPGRAPAARLGLNVIAVGHWRAELWGLRRLARELAATFPVLEVSVLLVTGPAARS